jgi:autotransporter strand-loop-strand O-heptosyltransferase
MQDFTINCEAKPSATPIQQPPVFAPPPKNLTQEAIEGIRFDFNDGVRVAFPNSGKYRCMLTDIDSGVIVYNMDVQTGAIVASVKKYFVPHKIDVFECDSGKLVFSHEFNAMSKDVLVQIPIGTLGDTIGWFSFVERFQAKHNCKLYVTMAPWIAEIFKSQYPNIKFITLDGAEELKPYATINLGLFFQGNTDNQPVDFRQAGLHKTAGRILGLDDLSDQPPRVDLSAERKIADPYVVIATQASSQAKYWNNPLGWHEVITHLKSKGYRVLCIDKSRVHGHGIIWNHIPNGAEDFTGDLPLQERIDLIKDAEMFIGLSSGLSWLAWCCRVPVVLISGFTSEDNEFYTPCRVINHHVCHSCWNDMRCDFDHFDFLWCPRHKNTEKHFECSKFITGKMVIDKINQAIKAKI